MRNKLSLSANLFKQWYLIGFAGLLLSCAGILSIAAPSGSLILLSLVFSISLLLAGILELIFAFRNRKKLVGWGWNFAGSLVHLFVAVIVLSSPTVSSNFLLLVAATVLLIRSTIFIGLSQVLKNYRITHWINLVALGVLGIIISFFIMGHPVFTSIYLEQLIGTTFIINGLFLLYYSCAIQELNVMTKAISLIQLGFEADLKKVLNLKAP